MQGRSAEIAGETARGQFAVALVRQHVIDPPESIKASGKQIVPLRRSEVA